MYPRPVLRVCPWRAEPQRPADASIPSAQSKHQWRQTVPSVTKVDERLARRVSERPMSLMKLQDGSSAASKQGRHRDRHAVRWHGDDRADRGDSFRLRGTNSEFHVSLAADKSLQFGAQRVGAAFVPSSRANFTQESWVDLRIHSIEVRDYGPNTLQMGRLRMFFCQAHL